MYGIWDKDRSDWVRELPSKVDDGGEALLVYTNKKRAEERAAKHFGFDYYSEAYKHEWCEVRKVV